MDDTLHFAPITEVPSDLTDQVARISYYEGILSTAELLVYSETASVEALLSIRQKIDELASYYDSDAWKQDFASDEAGLLPPNLKRGVLSEDGIYNLLERYRELSRERFHGLL